MTIAEPDLITLCAVVIVMAAVYVFIVNLKMPNSFFEQQRARNEMRRKLMIRQDWINEAPQTESEPEDPVKDSGSK